MSDLSKGLFENGVGRAARASRLEAEMTYFVVELNPDGSVNESGITGPFDARPVVTALSLVVEMDGGDGRVIYRAPWNIEVTAPARITVEGQGA